MNTKPVDYVQHFNQILLEFVQHYPVAAPKLKQALLYSLFPAGKRLRPLIIYYTGEVLNLKLDVLNPIAVAIELIHTYSLLHDDLPAMDNDNLRRGKLACHREFDEATAILVGDGLQPMAVEALVSLNTKISGDKIVKVIDVLSKASGFRGMVSGQSLDLSYVKDTNEHQQISKKDLVNIHNLKTGSLIHACVKMTLDAYDGSLSVENKNALENFAKHFGLLFQILDDYLDRYKISEIKKGRNSDLENNKITFANLYSEKELLQLISFYQKECLQFLSGINNSDKLVELVNEICNRIN